MYLLKRTTLALAAVATLGVGTARADLVLVGTVTVGGTGLGTVNTVLTLTSQGANTTEQGCVGRGAATDFIGSTPVGNCVAGAAPDVQTGASQTQTRSLAEAGITTGANFALLLNAVEPGWEFDHLEQSDRHVLQPHRHGAAHRHVPGAPHDFPTTQTGTGNTGEMFMLNAAEAATVQGFITAVGAANVRVGISTALTQRNRRSRDVLHLQQRRGDRYPGAVDCRPDGDGTRRTRRIRPSASRVAQDRRITPDKRAIESRAALQETLCPSTLGHGVSHFTELHNHGKASGSRTCHTNTR